jgi:exopolyphosphatase / guanosine-5'-triphosphate,3'-diphosphate pyrophosphatase
MKKPIRQAASIDIGTNSVLLLVAETDGSAIHVLDEQQAVPRLGKGVDASKTLHPDSIERVMDILKRFQSYLAENYARLAGNVIVTATSAVRDASNREAFMSRIKQETGWDVRLLSGDEEAQCTYRGAVSVLPASSGARCVLDIGGGSTEIAFGTGGKLISYISLDIGSVRFSERYLVSNPPERSEMELAASEIRKALTDIEIPDSAKRPEAVGVAGTVTSIAAIVAGHTSYNPAALNGCLLKRKTVERFLDEFSLMTAARIEEIHPEFLTGRGDVIIGGLIILYEFMRWLKLETMTVSTGGIRHGVLLKG